MALIKLLVLRVMALITRFPWAIALFGFVSGIISFFFVDRDQVKFAQMLSLLMLAAWIWLTLENLLHKGVTHWFGIKLPAPILKFAAQLVHQESLFFVIPFFFITTSWNSGQAAFTSVLIIAAVVSIIDPIYYGWLAARRWLYFAFHGITLFAVLLTALPILLHIPTSKSYVWSLVIAILLSFLNVVRDLPFNWWRRILVALLLITLTAGVGIYARPWIPPATLWLTDVAITERIDNENRAPENQLKVVTVDQLRTGLYAYTAIHAPRGLNERIFHEWRLNGMVVDRIALDINGGRDAGYRAWTHKMKFPPYPTGRWQIRVLTEADQVIGVLRFEVVEELSHDRTATPEERDEQRGKADDAADETINPANAIRKPLTEFIEDEGEELLNDASTSAESAGGEDHSAAASSAPGEDEASEESQEKSSAQASSAAAVKQVEPEAASSAMNASSAASMAGQRDSEATAVSAASATAAPESEADRASVSSSEAASTQPELNPPVTTSSPASAAQEVEPATD